jgi:hypothetical protein
MTFEHWSLGNYNGMGISVLCATGTPVPWLPQLRRPQRYIPGTSDCRRVSTMQPTTYRNRKKGLGIPSSSRDGRSSAASSDTEEHLPAPFTQASKRTCTTTLGSLTYTSQLQRGRDAVAHYSESRQASFIVVAVLTAIAFLLRFYKINHPAGVVCVLRPT